MDKYSIRRETLKFNDGSEAEFNVLKKARIKMRLGKELKPDVYYNVLEPSEIWFTDEEKEDILKLLKD